MPLLTRFTRSAVVLVAFAVVFAAPDARAATVVHNAALPLSPYLNGGTQAFPAAVIPKFDVAGGCLTSVCVKLDGQVSGLIAFENYDPFPKNVNVIFTGLIALQRPDLTLIVGVQPITGTNDNVPAFDGVLDYGGTSGITYPNVGASTLGTVCLTTPADLALFSGAGNIALPGYATDLSSQVGANSWSIGLRAYADITVTYTYTDCSTPAVPTSWGRIKSQYR